MTVFKQTASRLKPMVLESIGLCSFLRKKAVVQIGSHMLADSCESFAITLHVEGPKRFRRNPLFGTQKEFCAKNWAPAPRWNPHQTCRG